MIYKQTYDGVQIIGSDMLTASGGKVESLTITIKADAGSCIIIDEKGHQVGRIAVATKVTTTEKPAVTPHRRTFQLPMYPCKHRGDESGETLCNSCGGKVKIKLFKCELHQECTVHKLGDKIGVHCCKVCPDRKELGHG